MPRAYASFSHAMVCNVVAEVMTVPGGNFIGQVPGCRIAKFGPPAPMYCHPSLYCGPRKLFRNHCGG